MAGFEPKILAFCCWWCSYGAADLAGTSKMEYPTNVRIVRVPCTGRVDPLHILEAFSRGADGVLVAGCLKDGCHYVDGNIKAEARVMGLKKKLKAVGLGDERLEMYFMSAAQSDRFVQSVTEFTERIAKLGPSPLK
ncbi:MAG: hydrogenase iron-sulfur subunit [Candidatus Bathyarchaeia archaeon]